MPIYLKKERKKKAYKETMNIDIDNIKEFEIRHKVNKTQWRIIYEVI